MSRTELAGGEAGAATAFAGEADQGVLDDELNQIAGHLNSQHARLVDATVELLAHPVRWQGDGVWTAGQYLCWRVGLASHRTKQIVEIAERVDELPVCIAAFGRGELAVDAMAAIARRAPWWTDASACNYGQAMTVTQLRCVLAKYPFPDIAHPDDETATDDTSVEEADRADDQTGDDQPGAAQSDAEQAGDDATADGVRWPVEAEPDGHGGFHWDDTGRFRMSLDADAATGAIIEAALLEARDALFNDGNTNINWVDVIREICDRSLDSVSEPGRRDRYRINIHLDTDSNSVDAAGWRLPDAIRRYLTCDGLLSPVFISDGIPISVGRSQRIVPERTRRQVILRDQGCRVPGCGARRHLEVHHIIHWGDDGPTDTHNLICLCPHHHRLHHQGKFGITGNADIPGGVTFANVAGNPIAQTGTRPKPPGAPPQQPIGTYRHPLGERLDTKWVYFNPPPGHRDVAESPPVQLEPGEGRVDQRSPGLRAGS